MRAATLLAFVFAAVATPLLAAPVVSVDGSLVARDSLFSGNEARDFLSVAARDDESAAFFLPYMGRGRGPISVSALPWNSIPPATSNVPTVANRIPIPPAPAKRDSNPTAYSARELHELFLRAAEDDESGASFLSTLGGFLKNFIRRDDTLQRRDVDAMVELLARATEDDESGAGLFSGLVKGALHFLPDLFGGGSQPQQQQQQQRRDVNVMVELLRRAAEDDESGAGLFGTLGHIIGGLFSGGNNNRRDLDAVVELFARAAMDDELL